MARTNISRMYKVKGTTGELGDGDISTVTPGQFARDMGGAALFAAAAAAAGAGLTAQRKALEWVWGGMSTGGKPSGTKRGQTRRGGMY